MKLLGRRTADSAVTKGRPQFITVFRHRDFNFLTAGIMGTQLGSWVQTVAQGWLVFLITHSAFQLGLVGFIHGFLVLIVSPFSGAVADRFERRRLLVVATALSTVSGVTLALLVASHTIQIWEVYLTAMLDGLAMSINIPVRQVLVYEVVGEEELTTAIAINSLGSNLMRIVGPVLGGILIGYVSLSAAFFTQAGAYLFDLSVTLLLSQMPLSGMHIAPFFESVRGGLVYTLKRRIVLRLTLLALIPTLIVYPYVNFLPVFAAKVLHVGPQGYGLITTAVGYGSLIGGVIVAVLSGMRRQGLVTVAGTVAYMLLVFVFAFMHAFLLAFGVLVLAGIANSIYTTLNQTLVQLNTEDAYRGRVLSVYSGVGSLFAFGALFMGALIALLGPTTALAALCLLAVALAIALAIASPDVLRL